MSKYIIRIFRRPVVVQFNVGHWGISVRLSTPSGSCKAPYILLHIFATETRTATSAQIACLRFTNRINVYDLLICNGIVLKT